MKFRKKPIVVEAFKFTGGPDQAEDPAWFSYKLKTGEVRITEAFPGHYYLHSSEGRMPLEKGGYIIKGIKGEIYSSSAEVFEASYEAVDDESLEER